MDVYWVTIGNLLQFQPTRMILYICCFALGVYAFVKKWFIIGKIPGRLSVWVITCAGLLLGLLIIVKDLAVVPSPSLGLQFMFALVRSFLCLSLLIVFTLFSLNYWNRPSQINQLLAANSYNIYLVHYVVVVVFQFLLKDFWEVPILIKFGIVSLSSIFISYGISQYMIKAFPCLSIFGIFALFVCMSIFIHPV